MDDPSKAGNYLASYAMVATELDPTWPKTDIGWTIVPWGFRKLLTFLHERYPGIAFVITENGCAGIESSKEESINDTQRQSYLNEYIKELGKAINSGVNVTGYFLWSLLDNFEWNEGYTPRFGIVRVDFTTGERTLKGSANLYHQIIQRNAISLQDS